MSVPLLSPSLNDRLAIVYGNSKTFDKALKFTTNISEFSSDIFRSFNSSSSMSKALDAVGQWLSSERAGIKIFDIFRDIKSPNGDSFETKVKWIQLVGYTVVDVLRPILYFESQGFYSLKKELKVSLIKVGSYFGLVGIVANTVDSIYQFYRSSSSIGNIEAVLRYNRVDQEKSDVEESLRIEKQKLLECRDGLTKIHESIELLKQGQDVIARLNLQQASFLKVNNLQQNSRKTYFDISSGRMLSKDLCISDALEIFEKAKEKLNTHISSLLSKIAYCNEKIAHYSDLQRGRDYACQLHQQNICDFIENILELSATVLTISAASIGALPITSIIALIGICSSCIALLKIWKNSALTDEERFKYDELMAYVEGVLNRISG